MNNQSEKASSLVLEKSTRRAARVKGMAGHEKEFAEARSRFERAREIVDSMVEDQEDLLYGVIPIDLFSNSSDFIEMTRRGIPGAWLKKVVDETGLRDLFVSLLDVTSGNFSRLYQKPALDKDRSEEVLDVVRLIVQAERTWESRELAMQWLNRPVAALGDAKPVELFDTFEGRGLVSQALNKIEHGEFS